MNKKVNLKNVYYLEVRENERRLFILKNDQFYLPILKRDGNIELFNATNYVRGSQQIESVGEGKIHITELAVMQYVLDGDKNILGFKFSKKGEELLDFLQDYRRMLKNSPNLNEYIKELF